jgi:hypothetical protein
MDFLSLLSEYFRSDIIRKQIYDYFHKFYNKRWVFKYVFAACGQRFAASGRNTACLMPHAVTPLRRHALTPLECGI